MRILPNIANAPRTLDEANSRDSDFSGGLIVGVVLCALSPLNPALGMVGLGMVVASGFLCIVVAIERHLPHLVAEQVKRINEENKPAA